MALPDLATARRDLIAVGRAFDARFWVPATSGNFSARLADGRIAMTASGRHKGRLVDADIIALDADGAPRDGATPSAEAGLHLQLYRRFAWVGAVLHTHSPAGAALARAFPEVQAWTFEGQELAKAFPGVTSHERRIVLPIVANDQDMARLAAAVAPHLADAPPAYLIRGHGLYGWGRDVAEAERVVEAAEWLLGVELAAAAARGGPL